MLSKPALRSLDRARKRSILACYFCEAQGTTPVAIASWLTRPLCEECKGKVTPVTEEESLENLAEMFVEVNAKLRRAIRPCA